MMPQPTAEQLMEIARRAAARIFGQDDRDDAVADAIWAMLKALPRLRCGAPPEPYLRKIARNAVADFAKKEFPRREIFCVRLDMPLGEGEARQVAAPGPTPAEAAEGAEENARHDAELAALREGLGELPAEVRADMLRRPHGARWRHRKVIEKLRRIVESSRDRRAATAAG